MSETVTAVFRAVSHPARRRILELLGEKSRAVGEIVSEFDMTQAAVSQHLKVLRTAGLATPRREGKYQVYELDAQRLREAYQWLAHFDRFWDDKLGALGKYLDSTEEGSP